MDTIIKKVLEKIEEKGFKAYVVGGYVRDQLLGITSYDVDICTNALPKDIHNLFNTSNSNNYGGANFKIGKFNIDITTFREEIKYVGRNPVELKYVDDLETDLKRRDFTINAICMDINGKIIDLVNGVEDLNNRIIRSIGESDSKLREDPLRILRTIRFSTTLDFEIERTLYEALKENASLVLTLSKERVKREYSKIFMSENYKKGLDLSKELGLNKLLEIEYENINYTNDLLGMWAQIKIKDIPFTKEEKSNIIKIAEVVKLGKIDNYVLYKYGLYIATTAGGILGYSPTTINKIYKNLPITSRQEINITWEEIIEVMNVEPNNINNIYTDLENQILGGKLLNNNQKIKKYLIQHKG